MRIALPSATVLSILGGIVACSACKQSPTPLQSHLCSSGAVNGGGVGQPCRKSTDCTGTAAVTCPVESDPNGYDFCTRACYGLPHIDECGAGSECRFFRLGRGFCIPSACKDTIPKITVPPPVQVEWTCCVGQVNALGVGKVCTTNEDCKGLAANTCGIALDPSFNNWCAQLCQDDKECGDNAFCWIVPAKEGGYIGFCAPNACKSENHPAPCAPSDGGAPRDAASHD